MTMDINIQSKSDVSFVIVSGKQSGRFVCIYMLLKFQIPIESCIELVGHIFIRSTIWLYRL